MYFGSLDLLNGSILYQNTQAEGGLEEDTKQAKVSPRLEVDWLKIPSRQRFHSNTQARGCLEEDIELVNFST